MRKGAAKNPAQTCHTQHTCSKGIQRPEQGISFSLPAWRHDVHSSHFMSARWCTIPVKTLPLRGQSSPPVCGELESSGLARQNIPVQCPGCWRMNVEGPSMAATPPNVYTRSHCVYDREVTKVLNAPMMLVWKKSAEALRDSAGVRRIAMVLPTEPFN